MNKNYCTMFSVSKEIIDCLKRKTTRQLSSMVHDKEYECDKRFVDTHQMCTKEIHQLLWTAIDLKSRISQHQYLEKPLSEKRIILCSVQNTLRASLCTTMIISAIESLGAKGQIMLPMDWEKERYKIDIGRFYSKFCDAIVAQGHHHSSLCKLSEGASVPVLNASSHLFRPFHGLGTLVTLQETYEKLKGLTVAWIGPPDSVLNSFLYLFPKVGINFRFNCSCPSDQLISPIVYHKGKEFFLKYSTTITECLSPEEAIMGSDLVVTTNHKHKNKMITLKMLEKANEKWSLIHDLPRSGSDISPNAFVHKNNLVWRNQKNIFYIMMAALLIALKKQDPVIPMPNFERN